MKTCPICNRDYAEHMRYCSRDGAKLPIENLSATSTENVFTLPENLDEQEKNSSELISKKENLSPVVVSILEEIIKTGDLFTPNSSLEAKNNLPEDSTLAPPSFLETNQLTQQEPIKAADTRNLTAPAVLPFDTFGQYAVDQVSADRKLLIALALIVTFSVVGFAAYSFPYAIEWPKASADTKTKNLSPTEEPSLEPEDKNLSSNTEIPSKEDIIQKIDYPKSKETATSPLVKENSPKNNLKTENKINEEKVKNKSLPEVSKIDSNKINNDKKINNKEAKKVAAKEPKATSTSKQRNEIAKVNSKVNTSKNAATNTNAKKLPNNHPDKNSDKKLPPKANESVANQSQTWEKPTNETIKASRREIPLPLPLAKVIARVVNKSRLQTPNGYVYQFDLVVKELNGVKVKWNYTSARKTTYSGNSSTVSGLLGDDLDANGSIQFRMAVRMTGRCIEDWYGQIIYNCSGVDENGNSVELNQILTLDNNFPTAN